MLGSLLIFKKENKNIIYKSLGFASGVMLFVSLIDLIPESFTILENMNRVEAVLLILIFFNIGIILSMSINCISFKITDNKLYRVGILALLIVIMHNIPEGIATFIASKTDAHLGISIAIAIALHNIPEGISITIPIYYATRSKTKAILYTFISGCAEVFGSLIAYIFLRNYISDYILGLTFSVIAGLMFHISLYELFPNALSYSKKSILYFILGMIVVLINKFAI